MTTPLIILSHRKDQYLPETLASIRLNLIGDYYPVVVDDSGDEEHRDWLSQQANLPVFSVAGGRNAGYLEAMERVWEVATFWCKDQQEETFLFWEEDFLLTRPVHLDRVQGVLTAHSNLAQLNFQRQAVYNIERRLGYMESHQRRGYNLHRLTHKSTPWVSRTRPFTTNPGLFHRGILEVEWPSREEADEVTGGAEPAMSVRLERSGWLFGWYGPWNTTSINHVGVEMKSGTGY